MTAKPWSKFYWPDWRADPRLRMCSLAARGLWIEMLALMHEAAPYGHLLVNGVAPTARQLAGLVGAIEREVAGLLSQLEQAGVFSKTDDGTIYSRRMVRDVERATRDKANGAKGGNPQLNAGVNPQDKAQEPGARNQELERKEGQPLEKVNGLLSHAAKTRRLLSKEEKRLAWAGKISNELCRRETPERAMAIIEAWERGEKWAKDEFDKVDASLRAH